MSDATTCPACQRPTATAEQWATVPGGEGVGLCWGGRQCSDGARDALRALLARAARGELPRCDDCGTRLATMRWSDTGDCMCDECLRALRRGFADAGEAFDEAARVDLPHAAALRAAMGGAK
jgi:hypothetical protein